MSRHEKAATAARLAFSGALAALCLALPAFAQDGGTLKKIKDTGTITIGHRDASIPFSYYDDQQRPVGYAMDICMIGLLETRDPEAMLDRKSTRLNSSH